MKRALLLTLVLACHKEVKSESHVDTVTDSKAGAQDIQKADETVIEEPGTTIEDTKTVIEPVAPGPGVKKPQPGKTVYRHTEKTKGKVTKTFTWEDTGSEWYEGQTKLNGDTKTDVETDTGPNWKFYLTVLGVVILILAAGYILLKFELKRVP